MHTQLLALFLSFLLSVSGTQTLLLQNGTWLRFHVIAHDDTQAMQSLKYPVRDAVRQAYAAAADPGQSMLSNVQSMMPSLERAAICAARESGYEGPVDVLLLPHACCGFTFLKGQMILPGVFPSLIIRLGEGEGHNWWGLIDPALSLRFSRCAKTDTANSPQADWSFQAFLRALFGLARSGNAKGLCPDMFPSMSHFLRA